MNDDEPHWFPKGPVRLVRWVRPPTISPPSRCSGSRCPVRRRYASDTHELDGRKAKIRFDGIVPRDEAFVIDASREGERTLKSSTFVHVIDLDGRILQKV